MLQDGLKQWTMLHVLISVCSTTFGLCIDCVLTEIFHQRCILMNIQLELIFILSLSAGYGLGIPEHRWNADSNKWCTVAVTALASQISHGLSTNGTRWQTLTRSLVFHCWMGTVPFACTWVALKGPLLGATNLHSFPFLAQETRSPVEWECSILPEFSTALLCSIAAWQQAWMAWQSTLTVAGRIMFLPNTSWPGVAWRVVWQVHLIAWAAALNTSPKGFVGSNSCSSNSWVQSMLLSTWWICSMMELAWGLWVVLGFIPGPKPQWMMVSLNSALFSDPPSIPKNWGLG